MADTARRLSVAQRGGKLDLKGAGLTELPQQVWDAMPYLDKLDVSDNKVNWSLPACAIFRLTGVTTFCWFSAQASNFIIVGSGLTFYGGEREMLWCCT